MSLTDGATYLAKPGIMTDGTASKLGVQMRVGCDTLDLCNPGCTCFVLDLQSPLYRDHERDRAKDKSNIFTLVVLSPIAIAPKSKPKLLIFFKELRYTLKNNMR